MKRLLLSIGILLSLAGASVADEPAVVNDPANAGEVFKQFLSVGQPSLDYLFDVRDQQGHVGTSIRIATLEKVKYLSAVDVRGGFAETKVGYLELALALDRLTNVDLTRYLHLGWYAGKDFEGKNWETGFIFGVKADF